MSAKEEILFILEKNRGDFVSGQEIATGLGLTRSAVWKYVNSLKNEGYNIASVNNAGYMLSPESDILSVAGIRAHLDGESAKNVAVRVFKSIDSTNNEAKRAIAEGLCGEAIFASEEQTAGRGRRGRSFFSPNGSGLYFTAVLRTDAELSDATAVTTAAAVATADAIGKLTSHAPKIKWVNDVLIDGKKVCGILTEAVTDLESGGVQALIVGIGINLSTARFPEELKDIAGNIGSADKVIRNKLTAEIFTNLKAFCEKLPDRGYMARYRELSAVIGKEIYFERDGVRRNATALDILDDGGLKCRLEDGGTMILRSGEISIRLIP